MHLEESMLKGDVEALRSAIKEAEAFGLDALHARQRYSELERQGWKSPEKVRDIMKWAMSTQDGAILHNIIKEMSVSMPESEDLRRARGKLKEQHEEILKRMQCFARNRDIRSLAVALDRARSMGVPAGELAWAEEFAKQTDGTVARTEHPGNSSSRKPAFRSMGQALRA